MPMNVLIRLSLSCLLLLLVSQSGMAQQGSGFGLKAGLNYNTSGKYFKDAGQIFAQPGDNMGYHLGVFYQAVSYDIALRPELIFTQTQFETALGKEEYQKVDLPVLVKMRLFKVIGFSIGPSLHYTVREKISRPDLFESPEPFGLGFHMGLGLNIGPVGLDLRFEREMNERKFTMENVFGKEDYKSQQLIFGLSFKIPSLKENR